MKRDTLESFGTNHGSASNCQVQICKVAGYTIHHEDTQKWAQNLRFLAYDGDNSNDKGENDRVDEDDGDDEDETEGDEGNDMPFPECEKCHGLPYFPYTIPVKELRLTGDSELGDCPDFLAVSYCWSQNSPGNSVPGTTGRDYVVRKPDGTKRPNIAPKEILDRAIYIAANNRIRLIWIDQECIDQNDRMDKEFGIQSMDVVFERSAMVIGPLTLTIASNIQWNALQLLKVDENLPYDDGYMITSARFADHGLEIFQILESLVSERWFTRAWILQEMACASSRLNLLVRSGPGVVLGQNESKEFNLVLTDLRGMIPRLTADIYDNRVVWKFPPTAAPTMKGRLLEILLQLEYLSPMPDWRIGSFAFDRRTACNAIEALQYLAVRNNSRTPDQLAILANLCHYPVRLDTTKLESDYFSLSTCILVLALLNGDLSLLVGVTPEEWSQAHSIQHRRPRKRRRIDHQNTLHSFSWLPPQSVVLKEMNWSFENSCTCRAVDPKITSDGLTVQGYLWHINRQVYFKDIQENYGSKYMEIQDDEAKLQYHPKFARIYWEILTELCQQNLQHLADAIWHFVRAENDDLRILGEDGDQRPVADSFHLVEKEESRHLYYQRNNHEDVFMRYIDATEIIIWKLEEEARAKLGEMSPRLKWLMRREWLIDRVLRNGFLWVGGLANSTTGDENLCAVFDINEPARILTPHCIGLFGPARDKIRLERMSWSVDHIDGQNSSLFTSDMVRGMWNIKGLVPTAFTLV